MNSNEDTADRRERAFLSGTGLGCWQLGGAGSSSPSETNAHEILHEAYRIGVRHFDTAQSYGEGRSEDIVGNGLAGLDDARVATKIHFVEGEREAIERVEESRKRLRRDVIDLVYLHWPHRGKDVRPVLGGLEKARSKGWVRLVGVSNFSVDEMETASQVARIDAHQTGYSLLWRWTEHEVIPYCRAHGISFVAYTPLAQGLLTGKIDSNTRFAADDPRHKTLFYDKEVFPRVLDAVTRMKAIAEAHGEDLLHAAIGWVLRRHGVDGTIAGVKSLGQLHGTFTAELVSREVAENDETAEMDQELTAVSDEAMEFIPDIGNIFKHYP